MKHGGEDLRTIPSCVGGSSRRSIVSAKSIPAKAYGIQTGESVFTAMRKCPDLVVVEPDFALYRRCSKAFKQICREYAPVVQEFSIDECFLDFTGTSQIYPDPIALAYEIKDRIRDELGFTVNVGVANNKLCAKMASDFEKPDRVHTLFTEEVPKKMWHLPVGLLFLVGRSSADKLKRNGILTIGDLASCDLDRVKRLLGEKFGIRAWEYAHGIDESPVDDRPRVRKSYSHDITVEENIVTEEQAYAVLLSVVDTVARRMRRDGAKAGKYGAKAARSLTSKENSSIIQTGDHTLNTSTLKTLGLSKGEGKKAIEGLKRENGLPNNWHGKIGGDGSVFDQQGNYIYNLNAYR